MIDKNKWISTLPNTGNKFSEEINQIDHSIWTNTISKKKKSSSIKKYSFVVALFVSGLLLVSTVKNETRNLQKEINNLQASINVLNFNFDQALLDNEVITSPENISRLAKEYLNTDLTFYKKSQIRHLNDQPEFYTMLVETKQKKNKNLSKVIKLKVEKKIKEKKTEIKKLQELYSNPKSIPNEVKTQVVKEIKKKKIELANIYRSPKDAFTLERIQRWGVVQVVKVFLGIPIVPGR